MEESTDQKLPTAEVCKRIQTALDNMGRALKCPVCLSTLRDKPVVLSSCVHAFCQNCLSRSFEAVSSSKETSCPICKVPCHRRRSVSEAPFLGKLAHSYQRTLRHFGLTPVKYTSALPLLTQLGPEENCSQHGDDVAMIHRHFQVSKTFEAAMRQDKLASRNTILQQHQSVVEANGKVLLETIVKRKHLDLKIPTVQFAANVAACEPYVPAKEQTDDGEKTGACTSNDRNEDSSKSFHSSASVDPFNLDTKNTSNKSCLKSTPLSRKQNLAMRSSASRLSVQFGALSPIPVATHVSPMATSLPNGDDKSGEATRGSSKAVAANHEQNNESRLQEEAASKTDNDTSVPIQQSSPLTEVIFDEKTRSPVLAPKSEMKAYKAKAHHETPETDKSSESIFPASENSGTESFVVGDIIDVKPRTWPGINKQGGTAKIVKVNDDKSYDVAYVLGGREKRVDAVFCSIHRDSLPDRKKDSIPICLLQQLASEGFDVEGNQDKPTPNVQSASDSKPCSLALRKCNPKSKTRHESSEMEVPKKLEFSDHEKKRIVSAHSLKTRIVSSFRTFTTRKTKKTKNDKMATLSLLIWIIGFLSAVDAFTGPLFRSRSAFGLPSTVSPAESSSTYQAPFSEITKRRNLAIISHPDSGKTTMTEKLLLYGGALQQAGAVRHKAEQRSTQSDFLAMEQERGISISSTVLNFDYNDYTIRLLDTPGHQDFSEDTYRALAATDQALMLMDAAKGLEPQTRKLFEVCQLRSIPLFTFVNKMDRPALSPYDIMDQLEQEFGLEPHPILWPIGDGERFKGVLDRTTNTVHLYQKAEKRGAKAEATELALDDERLADLIGDSELYEKLMEDAELLNEMIAPLDMERVMMGKQSPLFFGSAMTNFGVQLFLDHFCQMGTEPLGRETSKDILITPDYGEFTGFVFKTQANLDPKHRDRLAYVRIVSGKYEKGMKVNHSRSKRQYNLAQAQALFGSDRTAVDEAFPGDVIGINNPGTFAIGDTLYSGNSHIAFPGIPSFSPEKFAYIRAPNPSDYKSFKKGIDQLLAEGAVQALRQRNDENGPLLLAAVGQLQFEVVQARLLSEYKVDSKMEPLGYSLARWVDGGWEAVEKADKDGKLFGIMIVQDQWKRPVLLFRNDWKAASLAEEEKYLELKPWSAPPIMDD